jgi:hypothetical protein
VDYADVTVVERRGGARFLQESFFVFGSDVQIVRQEFKRDCTIELEVEGFINDPHSADASGSEDLVATDLFVHGQWPHGRCHSSPHRWNLRRRSYRSPPGEMG